MDKQTAASHFRPCRQALKLAAAAELEKYGSLTPGRTLPEMPPAQLVHRVDHHLTFGKLRW